MQNNNSKSCFKRNYIYGAGSYGQKLLEIFNEIGISVDGFVQTECQEDTLTICGLPVLDIKKLKEINDNKRNSIFIFIAVKNRWSFFSIKNELCKIIPLSNIFDAVSIIENYCTVRSTKLGDNYCNVCRSDGIEFVPGGHDVELFKRLNVVGAGVRRNCICPNCNSYDRSRWLLYVLQNYTDLLEHKCRILHFAPEKAVSTIISAYSEKNQTDYYTCDYVFGRAMHVIDITDIPFGDGIFDYIICNHVLEHISDIDRAIQEIKRVLKPDGFFIFSFPVCMDQKTVEGKLVLTPKERLEVFGQEDHVRLYGLDYVEIYENYGFNLDIYRPEEKLAETEIKRLGLIPGDIIVIGKKRI